jgi:hypothetical protein
MRLYKYVEPSRIDILEKERIAFTPPDRFKDPFEFRPTVVLPNRTHLKQELNEAIKEAGLEWWQLPEAPKGLKRSERRKEDRRIKKLAFKQVKSGEARYAENFQDIFPTKIGGQFGILCLCANNAENLMWYHYADGHKGLMIEFDSEHPEFQKIGKPVQVIYSDKPPIYDFANPSIEHWRVKPKYLQYEVEYRILAKLPVSTPHKTPDGKPLYLMNLPRTCVKAIYLGHRMETSVRSKIFEILKKTTIAKFNVIPSRNDYTLSFQEIA